MVKYAAAWLTIRGRGQDTDSQSLRCDLLIVGSSAVAALT